MGFFRQEYGSRLPCPPPGDLPSSGIQPTPAADPSLQADSLPTSHQGSSDVGMLLGNAVSSWSTKMTTNGCPCRGVLWVVKLVEEGGQAERLLLYVTSTSALFFFYFLNHIQVLFRSREQGRGPALLWPQLMGPCPLLLEQSDGQGQPWPDPHVYLILRPH